MATSVSRQSG
jgi:integrase